MGLKNWAGNHTYRPEALHEPATVEELRAVVAGARRVRALGSRHSFNDLADGEELVSLEGLPVEIDVDTAASTVRVSSATRYGVLASRLHAEGWAVGAMASLPHISVAGAVATATHGSGDRQQNLSAGVSGLELVTADGDLVTLTREDPDLAGAVVGLGALGVVTALTLDVQPTYDVAQEVHTDLPWDVVLDRMDEVTSSATSVSLFTDWSGPTVAQVWRKSRVDESWEPRQDLFGAPVSTRALHPLPGVDGEYTTRQLGVPGPWHERLPHFRMEFTPSFGEEIQSEYLVAREHAPAAIQAVRALSPLVTPLLLVSEVRTIAADDLWLSMAYGHDSVALHFTWQQRQPEVTAVLPAIEEALAPFAPRPHWGKLFTATGAGSPAALEAAYPRMADFRALTARLDPEGRFRNEFLERHGLVG